MILSRLREWMDRGERTSNPARHPHRFTALSGDRLLQPFKGEVAAIRARVGVPPEHWRQLYESVLRNYASLVQQLPASESHHHAGAGGLLQHGLEVLRHTLDLKQGVMLPRGASPEAQARLQDLWTYACATAALLHDLGKPVTDHRITFYDNHGLACGAWSALSGPMAEGSVYGIEFNTRRVYRQHERIPPLLAHHLIPSEGLAWLASDSEALFCWLAAIQGDLSDAGVVGEIIGKSDGLSVARNLSGSTHVRLPTAKARPLTERLVTGLRYLLDNGELPLNRRGAPGYLDGDALWMVSKTTLDKLRTHLIEEGQPGIPSRNDRLMDELQQHCLLVPNGDRAVWLCEIIIGDWQQQLTCLCFDPSQIWSNPDRRPKSIDGSVAPVEIEHAPAQEAGNGKSTATGNASKPTADVRPSPPERAETPADASDNHASTIDGLPMPFDTNVADDSGDDESTGAADPQAPHAERSYSANEHGARESRATDRGNGQVEGMDSSEDAGSRFLAWLRRGIRDESMEINSPKARIHVLPEGLVLVSPGIFRDFDSANWSHVQKRFQKLGLHRKAPDDRNIWTCQAAGSRKKAILKVFLIPDPQSVLGATLPAHNSAVTLLEN